MCIRDRHTIVIGLSDPMGTFPAHLANPECVIASKKAFEEGGGDYLDVYKRQQWK